MLHLQVLKDHLYVKISLMYSGIDTDLFSMTLQKYSDMHSHSRISRIGTSRVNSGHYHYAAEGG